ncbi:mediator of RNA polymerase II transcription subunit 28 [Cinnamomum micranthum f. kanehirae]|uniref:Mediator of RNA polymerase II transcription subunit 28 n=1 Tax=Cinnamomum micranthum f. kanehirae TaxID=337451 RepID=A0A443PTT3_9MAGN|nr:mediator of RNA polymerase II transcription subunit 28 [Cinnamomum micranthum f. kanehirae]
MDQSPPHEQQQQLQMQSPGSKGDMIDCVVALERALLPCLPARELQAIDRSAQPSHQIHPLNPSTSLFQELPSFINQSIVDVERHARDFMEAAKKLQLYFIGLQHQDQPTKEETLRKEIAMMEEELKTKSEMIKKHEKLIQGWRKELKDQLDKHITELERV